jgi:valyl-tRNA synthetase
MDSSITALVHAGWPDETEKFGRLFPANLQPNGLDIVRTWDYYLLVRSLALFGKPPYKTLLINGMVRGTDGRMMHKSYGNYVESGEAMSKYGADPLRQWAASGGATGSDIPFRWTEMDHGKKFLTKLWNIARYIITSTPQAPGERKRDHLPLLDRWLLSCLQDVIKKVSEHFENRDFNLALETIREFAWHTLADDYLEAVKHRLAQDANDEERENAQFCLYRSLLAICKLLAPICPHIADAIFIEMPKSSEKPPAYTSQGGQAQTRNWHPSRHYTKEKP